MPSYVPMILAGDAGASGAVDTGQVRFTYGSTHCFVRYSGSPSDTQIHAGKGRLDSTQLHTLAGPQVASGKQCFIYDAAVAGTGIEPLSGHILMFSLDPRSPFLSGALTPASQLYQLGIPYNSGLCISSFSGAAGITINYTPAKSGT